MIPRVGRIPKLICKRPCIEYIVHCAFLNLKTFIRLSSKILRGFAQKKKVLGVVPPNPEDFPKTFVS